MSEQSPEDEIQIPKRRFLELLPRRSLWKAAALLLLLAAVIYARQRSDIFLRRMNDVFGGRPAPEAGAEKR